MWRSLAIVMLVAGCNGCGAHVPPPAHAGVAVYENPTSDDTITEGDTTLPVDVDTAYAAAADVTRWPTIFADIRQAIVTERTGPDVLVTFIHPDGERDNLHFRNDPATRTVWFEDRGGRAVVWAEIRFTPGPQPHTTRVHTRLYAHVGGLASLFVSDDRVRDLRQQRVGGDLSELRKYFTAHSMVSIP